MSTVKDGAESDDSEIAKALAESKKQFDRGEVGAEQDIFNVLRGEEASEEQPVNKDVHSEQ